MGTHFACVPQNRACVLMHNHYVVYQYVLNSLMNELG